MKTDPKFIVKQYVKMFCQHVLLPAVYNVYRLKPVKKGYVIMADAHHESLPFSMSALRREFYEHPQFDVREMFHDNNRHGLVSNVLFMLDFMREYAQAQTVILCDDFLPAAACSKRRGTKVIQLWHACGAFKKFGRDSREDIPSFYRGSVTKNWNMVTVSSSVCVRPFAHALGLPTRRIRPIGVSRTDEYFDRDFNDMCRRRFYAGNPGAAGKKVILWAPTFRGNASRADVEGLQVIQQLMKELEDQYYFVIKLHPHSEAHLHASTTTMPTEELLASADLVITDYSSVLFDAMAYDLPVILYAPDLDTYLDGRGFYLNFDSIPAVRAENKEELREAIKSPRTLALTESRRYRAFYDFYMAGCDGQASARVMHQIIKWSNLPDLGSQPGNEGAAQG